MVETPDRPNDRPRILVVDDEPAVIALVRPILQRAGYDVVPATSAPEAIAQLDDSTSPGGRPFDCVITDALMPQISGQELVRLIRSQPRFAKLPVIMLTRQRQRENVRDAVEAGVTDYVLKPIDESLLVDKVALAIQKGGTRHIYELTISGELQKAKMTIPCRVLSISENDITMLVPFLLGPEHAYPLKIRLFEEIGITMPELNRVKCDPMAHGPDDAPELKFHVKMAFLGVPEDDLKKIRSWIQREAIKRKK
jgi:CheY-like chemotaxis protein